MEFQSNETPQAVKNLVRGQITPQVIVVQLQAL